MLGSMVQRRENVGGSLNPWTPQMFLHLVIGFASFDESKYNTDNSVCQVFCQKIF